MPLVVPNPEAEGMEMMGPPVVLEGSAHHRDLICRDVGTAGVAHLSAARSALHFDHSAVRQQSVLKPAPDDEADDIQIQQIFTLPQKKKPGPAVASSPRSECRSASDTARHHSGQQPLPPDSPVQHSEWHRGSADFSRASPQPSRMIGAPTSRPEGAAPCSVSRSALPSRYGAVRALDDRGSPSRPYFRRRIRP